MARDRIDAGVSSSGGGQVNRRPRIVLLRLASYSHWVRDRRQVGSVSRPRAARGRIGVRDAPSPSGYRREHTCMPVVELYSTYSCRAACVCTYVHIFESVFWS
jgi:hypothetical protein